MKVTIPVASLREALTGFRGVVTRGKASLPFLQSVLFEAAEDGSLVLMGTDLDQWVWYRCLSGTATPGTRMALSLGDLADLTKEIRGETLEFTATEGLAVEATYVEDLWRTWIELEQVDTGEWPNPPNLSGAAYRPGDGFLDAYRKAKKFSSRDETRYVLNGVYFQSTDEKTLVTATDGRRLITGSVPASLFGNRELIVPCTTWLQAAKGPVRDLGFLEDGNRGYVIVDTGLWRYVCRQIEGGYPNYKQVIPNQEYHLSVTFGKGCESVFRFLTNMTDAKSLGVKIENDNGKVVTRVRNPEKRRKVKVQFEDATITGDSPPVLDVRFVLDLIQSGFRKVEWHDDVSPVVSKNEGWTLVLMPMRGW